MAPKAMKTAMKTSKAMTKGALAEALATESELKKSVCAKLIGSLAEIATEAVKKDGVFTLPGLCRIKTRMKPATKAGKREVFGKVVMVKAKPAKMVVKAFPVAALKASV
jgi:nucleoid DNA-binding protein